MILDMHHLPLVLSSHRTEWRLFIFLFLIVFAIVVLLALLLTGGFIFRYLFSFGSKMAGNITMYVHCGASVLAGLFMPNYFLSDNAFFQKLFEQNALWIPVSMLAGTFICLIVLGTIINSIAIVLEKFES